MKKWDNVRKELRILLKKVTSYDDFLKVIANKSSKEKGDYFEYYTKAFFHLLPEWKCQIRNYYLFDEIQDDLSEKLGLPKNDKGIDGILEWNNGNLSAVQVKYRKNRQIIPFGELATFPALLYGTQVGGFQSGILFTNCFDACNELKNDKYLIINDSSLRRCDNEFWNNFRNYLMDDEIHYERKEPREYQTRILNRAEEYYSTENNGRLYMPCGTGKSLMGVWISEKLDAKTIFISVPSIHLLSETFETWARNLNTDDEIIEYVLIGSDIDKEKEDLHEFKLTTKVEDVNDCIEKYLNSEIDYLIVITTYQSSLILIESAKEYSMVFDFGIFDEAHRTTGCEDKEFTRLIGENSIVEKRLFMTATERVYNGFSTKDEKVYSMSDKNVYGDVIYRYSTRMAIDGGQLVDYNIVSSYITDDEFSNMLETKQIINALTGMYDVHLLFTCLMILESMKEYDFRHILVFSNTNKRALDVFDVLNSMIEADDEMCDVYLRRLTGSSSMTRRKQVVTAFSDNERGIISSAKIFGEGVNIPMCDAVCFVDNKSSTVDIQQYVGRCLRLCKEKPDKKSYVLVPLVMEDESDFLESDNLQYQKIRRILRAMAQTDEMIQDKFFLKHHGAIGGIVRERENDDEEIAGIDANVDELRESILLNAMDRLGDPITESRKALNDENNLRYANGDDLLIGRNECIKFLTENNKETNLGNYKNWFRFCVGNRLYDALKNKYYYTVSEFKEGCKQLGIISASSYRNEYFKDHKLPALSWISHGFYEDMKNGFTILDVLGTKTWKKYRKI